LKNPVSKLEENFDKRLHNILYAWANNDVSQLKPQDYQHLANLMKQKIRPGQIRRYEKDPLALRGQQRFLKAEAYQHAFGSIAEELYRAMDEPQRKLIDLAKGEDFNYLVDVRTNKEKIEASNIFKELAPKNLLKVLVMLWGSGLAVLNAIASKGNVLNNEYFWIGTSAAGIAGMDLADRPLLGGKFTKMLAKERRAEKMQPFKKAKEVNGATIANKGISLERYMKNNPDEVAMLRAKWQKNPNQKLSKLIRDSESRKEVNLNTKGKGDKIDLIVKGAGERTIKSYERHLFYTALDKLGIKTFTDLGAYQSVQRMEEKKKKQLQVKKDVVKADG